MVVSERLRRLLTEEYADYRLLSHPQQFSAQKVAAVTHVPGRELAKVLVVRDAAGGYLMVVVPGNCRLDLKAVELAAGRRGLRLAAEPEFGRLFPDCELGAMRFDEYERLARPVVAPGASTRAGRLHSGPARQWPRRPA